MGKLHLCQRFRPGYYSCLVLLPGTLGSAPGDSAGARQDPTSVAEAALLVLVNLSQVTPAAARRRVAWQSLPTKSFLIFLI